MIFGYDFEWVVVLLLVIIIATLQTKQLSQKEIEQKNKANKKAMWWILGIAIFSILLLWLCTLPVEALII